MNVHHIVAYVTRLWANVPVLTVDICFINELRHYNGYGKVIMPLHAITFSLSLSYILVETYRGAEKLGQRQRRKGLRSNV